MSSGLPQIHSDRSEGTKNAGGKKFQEDSQVLFESQENIFQKISAELSQSSHSTNIGDLEEILLQAMDTGYRSTDTESEETYKSLQTYHLRTRTIMKQPRKKLLKSQCFIPKSPNASERNSKLIKIDYPLVEEENMEMKENSQESVSMLQECYQKQPKNEFPQLMVTCTDSELEVVDIYSDEETENLFDEKYEAPSRCATADSSTQTKIQAPRNPQPNVQEVAKHASFISAIVKLKAVLSSKKTNSNAKLSTILTSTEGIPCQEENPFRAVPKETIGYLLRSSHVENIFCETVRALLQCLEDALRDDFFKAACFWKNSIYENAVEMLNEAVDWEVEVWKMVDLFLCRTIKSIIKDGGKSKNLVLESKANFVISFCQSTHLSCTTNSYTIRKLEKLKIIKKNTKTSLSEKISWTYLIKNSFFLLRILESSLRLLSTKVKGKKFDDVIKRPEVKNYNVLEMWKKHWKQNEVKHEEKVGHEWETVVNDWCKSLDEVLLHCVSHVPILSMAVERCGDLAKEILKMCHPGVMGVRRQKQI